MHNHSRGPHLANGRGGLAKYSSQQRGRCPGPARTGGGEETGNLRAEHDRRRACGREQRGMLPQYLGSRRVVASEIEAPLLIVHLV